MKRLHLVLVLAFCMVASHSYSQGNLPARDTIFVKHTDMTGRDAVDAVISAETTLSYKYQVILMGLSILVSAILIVGALRQWRLSERQDRDFKERLDQLKLETASVKARADDTIEFSRESMKLSRELVQQERDAVKREEERINGVVEDMRRTQGELNVIKESVKQDSQSAKAEHLAMRLELDAIREKKDHLNLQLTAIEVRTTDYKAPSEIQEMVVEEVRKQYDRPEEIRNDCRGYTKESEDRLQKQLDQLRSELNELRASKG